MMRRLYDWMMRMAGHKKAPQALFWVAFIESSVFPIPPDVMLIPMILAQRAKAFLYATICLAGSVIGGVAGYAIGYYLFDLIGEPILRVYGYGEKYQQTADLFNEWGPWILIAKGWTPFPYKVLTIAAGAFKDCGRASIRPSDSRCVYAWTTVETLTRAERLIERTDGIRSETRSAPEEI